MRRALPLQRSTKALARVVLPAPLPLAKPMMVGVILGRGEAGERYQSYALTIMPHSRYQKGEELET